MMNASQNYTMPKRFTDEEEAEIDRLLVKYPLWKRTHAKQVIARARHSQRIAAAKPTEPTTASHQGVRG